MARIGAKGREIPEGDGRLPVLDRRRDPESGEGDVKITANEVDLGALQGVVIEIEIEIVIGVLVQGGDLDLDLDPDLDPDPDPDGETGKINSPTTTTADFVLLQAFIQFDL